MIIHCLSILGFGIIGDSLEVSFPEECRLGILGSNETGKTTLIEAIEYALYGLRGGPSAEEQRENIITWGKNEARLEIEFTSGQERYILERVIGVKSGHRARLVQLINGSLDQSSALTSIKEIEAKIEQITGMDRDSFTKLVYIKQKDLDALRDLAKSKREQLVNKVMGIEVFDMASEKVKEDVKKFQKNLDEKNIRMESIRRNKELYEEKLKQKDELEIAVSSLKQALEQKKVELDEAEGLLGKYEWLYASNSINEVLSSLRDQLEEVQKRVKEIENLEERLSPYEDALAKYKPKIDELETVKATFFDLEKRLKEAKDGVELLKVRVEEAIKKAGLTGRELEALAQSLPRKKRSLLTGFGILLPLSLVLIVGGLLTNLLISLVGVALLPVALFIFMNYLKTDNLLAKSNEVLPLKRQEAEQNKKVNDITTDIERQVKQYDLKSSEEAGRTLVSILDELFLITENRSIQGLEAIINNTRERLNKLKDSKPSSRAKDLLTQIQNKEEEIKNLEKNKPHSVDELTYDKSQHENARKRADTLQTEYNNLDKEIQNKLGTISQLSIDLKNLKPDYDSYPQLEKEIKELQHEMEIRKLLLNELSETSKELRNKVIPHARFIINQILPTLTDGRYSDFEITEDLKFKVHSMDAGGYKEREIFSGGTQDQFLIALRLAFTQSILDSRIMADKYSLLMDECISSSDEARKQGIFEVLEAMKKTFSQIFIIAHEDISNYVDHHMVMDRNRHGYTEIRSRSW